MSAATSNTPCFLIEHLYPVSGEVAHCDVTAFLANALDSAFQYLSKFPDDRFVPQVDVDEEGLVEGVAFFDGERRSRVFITRYHLERDELDLQLDNLAQIAALSPTAMQQQLAKICA